MQQFRFFIRGNRSFAYWLRKKHRISFRACQFKEKVTNGRFGTLAFACYVLSCPLRGIPFLRWVLTFLQRNKRLIKYSHRRRRAYAYLMSLSNEEMGNIMEFMCAQYSIVNGVLRRLISFSREHRTPRQLLQFWAEVARDMSEAATIDISYLLNNHGQIVGDIWLTEPAFTLSEEFTPDGCFVDFEKVGSNGLGAFGSCPIPDVNFLFFFFFFKQAQRATMTDADQGIILYYDENTQFCRKATTQ